MAGDAPTQKRKRGRPSNASRPAESASEAQDLARTHDAAAQEIPEAHNGDVEEDARPRKRGRPAKGRTNDAPAPQQAQDKNADDEAAPARKRGRRAKADAQEQEASVEEAEEQDSSLFRRSGRDRRSTGEWFKAPQSKETTEVEPEPEAELEEEDAHEDSSFLRRSGRDRRSVGEWYRADGANASPEEAQPTRKNTGLPSKKDKKGKPQSESEQVPKGKAKKRGRPSMEGPQPEGSAHDHVPTTTTGPKKRGRPSLGDSRSTKVVETAAAPGETKKRGRPPSVPSLNAAVIMRSAEKAKNRGRPSKDVETTGKPSRDKRQSSDGQTRRRVSDLGTPSSQQKSKSTKRRRSSQEQTGRPSHSPDPISSPVKKYQHLSSKIRRIPRHTISAKWSPLDETSISSITNLLSAASRPVLLRLSNPNRRADATAALNAVSSRLRSKLVRGLPFPPAATSVVGSTSGNKQNKSRQDELEFERTLDGIRILETQLNPLLHGVDLLQREKERMEKELERDYKVLEELSTNARAEARQRRERGRKLHSLVPVPSEPSFLKDEENEFGEIIAGENSRTAFEGLEDNDLLSLATQITSHMESMKGNLLQIDGVNPEIKTSAALLRGVLENHLDQGQFEKVLLG